MHRNSSPRGRNSRRAFVGRVEALEVRQVLSQFVVSPAGNDSAAGTAAAPWKTLQRAANLVSPGDSVSVKAGTYAGFNLTTSGTQGAPIVFKADAGVSITSPNPWNQRDGINLEGASWVTVDGFSVSGMPRAGIRSVTNTHATIRNNNADLNTYWGIFTGFSEDVTIENNAASRSAVQHGIYVSNSADRPVIRNNTVWGNNASGIQINADGEAGGDGIITGAFVEGNVVRDNGKAGGAALNNDGVQNSTFRNNLLYNNHGSGISFFRQNGSDGSRNNLVVNNTIVNATDGRWAATLSGGSTGNVFRNNILYTGQSFRGSITVSPDSIAGFNSDFNVVKDRLSPDGENSVISLASWRALTGNDVHSIVSDPTALFANASANDYHLKSGSPAFDAATNAYAPVVDLAGLARPQGASADIGAYETAVAKPSATNSAAFLALDTATQGNWAGRYGSDGVLLNAASNTTPAYAKVSVSNASNWTWAATSSDARGLRKSAGSAASDRIAACWYSNVSLSFDVNLTDGQSHRVALYALDWDQNGGRNERIDVLDANTGAVLSTQALGKFQGGQYLSWNLQGHVVLRVTNTSGVNAVVSGLFFGGNSTPASVTSTLSLAPVILPTVTITPSSRKPKGGSAVAFLGS